MGSGMGFVENGFFLYYSISFLVLGDMKWHSFFFHAALREQEARRRFFLCFLYKPITLARTHCEGLPEEKKKGRMRKRAIGSLVLAYTQIPPVPRAIVYPISPITPPPKNAFFPHTHLFPSLHPLVCRRWMECGKKKFF